MPDQEKSPQGQIADLAKALAEAEGARETVRFLRDLLGNIEPVTRWCPEIAHEICERMANGETIDQMAKEPHMPDRRSIRKWAEQRPDFGQDYARARVAQMHAWADQIVALSDEEVETGYTIRVDLDSADLERIEKNGVVTFKYRRKHIDRARLMIDTRKWLMARIAAEDFGEKQQVSVTHSFDQREDDEIMAELQAALRETGLTIEDVTKMLAGPVQ